MHVSKISKAKNAFISVLCASTMAFSLATPYLAFADAPDAETKAQTKIESTVKVDAADEVAGDTNTGAETVEPGTGVTDATNQAADATVDNQTNADPQKVDATETATEVVAFNGDEPAPAADQAEKVTVTLYGPNETTVEVAKGGKLTAAQLTAPSSATFPLWCTADLPGTFVGWYIGKLDGKRPALKNKQSQSNTGGLPAYSWENIYLGNKSVLCAWGVETLAPKVDENTVINEATVLFPVYSTTTELEEFYVRVFIDGVHWQDNDWLVPKGYKLNGSDVAILKDYYQNSYIKESMNDPESNFNSYYDMRYYQGMSATKNPNDKTPIVGKNYSDFKQLQDKYPGIHVFFGKNKPAEDEITLPPVKVKGTTAVKAYGELSGANIPAGAEVAANAETVTSGQAYDELNEAIGDSRIGDIFDIKLMVNGVEVHDGFGELTISLPVSAEYEGHVIVIYHPTRTAPSQHRVALLETVTLTSSSPTSHYSRWRTVDSHQLTASFTAALQRPATKTTSQRFRSSRLWHVVLAFQASAH